MSWAPPVGAVTVAAGMGVCLIGSAPLDAADDRIAGLRLDARDTARRDAYRLPADRARFLTGRVLLADHLARRHGLGPADYRLYRQADQPGEWRPLLAATRPGGPALPHFSIAHSGDRVLLVFSDDREVGVDVERRRSFTVMPVEVERQFLTAAESSGLPGGDRRVTAVAQLFSRKEAVLKAIGFGLAVSPLTLTLAEDGDGRPRIDRFDSPHAAAADVVDLAVGEGYVAALAVVR